MVNEKKSSEKPAPKKTAAKKAPAKSAAKKASAAKAAAASVGSPSHSAKPSEFELYEEIRLRAYELYQERGGQDGSHEDDWRRAEAEVRSRHNK